MMPALTMVVLKGLLQKYLPQHSKVQHLLKKTVNKLIQFALSMIPGDCRLAKAVNTAVEAKKND